MLEDVLKHLINPVDRIGWAKSVIELDPYNVLYLVLKFPFVGIEADWTDEG